MEEADTSVKGNRDASHSEIDELTKDYSRYLHVNAAKERQAFYDSIEEMLTKLDEFGGLIDMIRSDTNLCLSENVPRIQGKCDDMKKLFTRIDQLEAFVGIVRQNIGMMEELLDKAEQDMGSFSVKNFFSSLLGPKKPPQSKESHPTFDPPEIFVTEEYLIPDQPVQKLPTEQVLQEQGVETVAECKKETQDGT